MSEHSVDESFHLAAMALMRTGTPYVRRERKPWTPREPINIALEDFNEVSADNLSGGDADVPLLGPEMAEG